MLLGGRGRLLFTQVTNLTHLAEFQTGRKNCPGKTRFGSKVHEKIYCVGHGTKVGGVVCQPLVAQNYQNQFRVGYGTKVDGVVCQP